MRDCYAWSARQFLQVVKGCKGNYRDIPDCNQGVGNFSLWRMLYIIILYSRVKFEQNGLTSKIFITYPVGHGSTEVDL